MLRVLEPGKPIPYGLSKRAVRSGRVHKDGRPYYDILLMLPLPIFRKGKYYWIDLDEETFGWRRLNFLFTFNAATGYVVVGKQKEL